MSQQARSAEDPGGWRLGYGPDVDPRRQRVIAALLAQGNGTHGVVGDVDVDHDAMVRLSLVAGAYGAGPDGVLRPLPGPVWTDVGAPAGGRPGRWTLDLRDGTVRRDDGDGGVQLTRFVSLARPRIAVVRARAPAGHRWPAPLACPVAPAALCARYEWLPHPGDAPPPAGATGPPRADWWRAATRGDRTTVAAVVAQRSHVADGYEHLDRIVALGHAGDPPWDVIERSLCEAEALGVDALLDEHRSAWADRWAGADIEIDGDPDAQLAVRFALFHLLSCAPISGEAIIGARGLTGLAYAGHVFWDTDVYVVPALSAVLPAAARAAIEYRLRRLPAARARAAARGRPGACYPWESADTGDDVTPASARGLDGTIVEIRTGTYAEHITSDVVWSAVHHDRWTTEGVLDTDEGRELVLATARYWAGRIDVDPTGRAHVRDVIGPDEYHERVDDDTYTNGLVRWHLRLAADLLGGGEAGSVEATRLRRLASALVDGYDATSGRHEQFAGFWDLEPVLIADIATPPVAADVLLGRAVIAGTQVLKQPSVLMLHHLLPDDLPTRSLGADLDFELPRIAHGSSLSPASCAGLLARAGRLDEAMDLFDLAARLDLDDRTGTTAAGLHLATMGGLWQAVVAGFAGIRAMPDAVHVEPRLPSRWRQLRVHLRHRQVPVTFTVSHERVRVDAGAPVPLVVDGESCTAPIDRSRPTAAARSTR